MCYNSCGIVAHRLNGVIVKIEGDPNNPQNWQKICPKGNAAMMSLYNPDRITKPRRRRNPEKGLGIDPQWEELSFEEAQRIIVEKLRQIRNEDPRKLVISTFDVHPANLFFAWCGAYGTPNVYWGPAAYYCGNGFHPVCFLNHGTFWSEPDLERCNYVLMIGSQTGFVVNHLPTKVALHMADARMRGMKLVVVDPIGTNAAAKADEWIPIRPGTDGAFALAILNVLLNELGIYDREFLEKFTNAPYLVGEDGLYVRDEGTRSPMVWDSRANKAKPFSDSSLRDPSILGYFTLKGQRCGPAFQVLKDHVQKYTPEFAADITTVPADTIRRLAKELGEAASIGATIMIDGAELPYRPACVNWSRGPSQHKHAALSCIAIGLINVVLGAIDVPGGDLGSNPIGPEWAPRASNDGLLMPTNNPYAHSCFDPYPARRAGQPQTFTSSIELFPVAPYSDVMFFENLLRPEIGKFDYRPEMLIISRCNPVTNNANPQEAVEALKRIPFIVAISFEENEVVELADLVLPDAHFLERFEPFPNEPYSWQAPGTDPWVWLIRQPVVSPPPGVRSWIEYLFEFAHELGLTADLNLMLNALLDLKEPWKLWPNRPYTYQEIIDAAYRSRFGPEHGLDWMKVHGYYARPKTVKEAFPRVFMKERIPTIYLEHFIPAGREVRHLTQELGIDWDVGDYQPVPDWKPCPSFKRWQTGGDGYNLFLVSHKVPQHTFAFTLNNPWLKELGEQMGPWAYGIKINARVAVGLGIRTGDEIYVESEAGYRVKGKAVVTECIHHEVVGISGQFGKLARGERVAQGIGVSSNTLLTQNMDLVDTVWAGLDTCLRVRISKAQPAASQGHLG
jgi:molybdopterin-containing oxidoreductase family molybdopterin binding subunit